MSRTKLALAQDLVRELGVRGGTGPAAIANQSGQYKELIGYLTDGDVNVQNEWFDWDFLWLIDEQTATAGERTLPALASSYTIRQLANDALILRPGTSTWHAPEFMEWPDFRALWYRSVRSESDRPANFTLRPDGTVELSHLFPENTDYSLEAHRRPIRMPDTNEATSPIPEAYDRIIVVRAKIIYAEREDAPEVLAGSSAEYDWLLDKLEADCLPGQKRSRTARDRAPPMPSVE